MQLPKFLKTFRSSLGYRSTVIFIVIGSLVSIGFLMFSNQMSSELQKKEYNETKLWARAITIAANPMDINTPHNIDMLIKEIMANDNDISFIATEKDLSILSFKNVNENIIVNPNMLREELEDMTNDNEPIEIEYKNGNKMYIFYRDSRQLILMKYLPYVQIFTLAILIGLVVVAFYSSKNNEQNKIWIGMAKETAHQLGTPSSSLLGWLEYLKNENIDKGVVEEIGKDISRLLVVVDRFSKIGSATVSKPTNIVEIIAATLLYFQVRKPKNVTIEMENSSTIPIIANINAPLISWVLENMVKNAIDAIGREGKITILTKIHKDKVIVDIKDSGKGISKKHFKKIFKPGFSTKTRGWGLGLSLCKRIIEENHGGKLYVAESGLKMGATIRIELNK